MAVDEAADDAVQVSIPTYVEQRAASPGGPAWLMIVGGPLLLVGAGLIWRHVLSQL